MFSSLFSNLSHYFPRHLAPQLRELYVTIGILNLATAAVIIFEPIYLLQQGYQLSGVISFYLSVYLIYFFIMPLGAKVALRFGYNKGIIISSLFLIGYYLSLLGLKSTPAFILTAIPSLAIQKALYWPGFHSEFARYGDSHEEAREVSNREVIDIMTSVVGPFFGGLTLYLSNFSTLFIIVCLLILISNLPLLITPEVFTPGEFSYLDAYRRLVVSENRRYALSFLGYGEEFIVLVIWPIYMFTFMGSFLSLGSLVAATTLLTATIILYVGRLADHSNKRHVLKIGSILYALVWWLRPFITSVSGIFTVDALSRLTKKILAVPQLSIIYEQGRETHHIMRNSVLFEMSLVIGKILAMLAIIVVFSIWPASAALSAWSITFIMAGLFTLLYPVL